jgi:hypothetical protein
MANMPAMPTLHVESGYALRFFSADRKEPPHVHVYGNGGSAKLWLATIEVAKPGIQSAPTAPDLGNR